MTKVLWMTIEVGARRPTATGEQAMERTNDRKHYTSALKVISAHLVTPCHVTHLNAPLISIASCSLFSSL